MSTRRPIRAQGCAVFPSLAALTAGGVIASGCHAPQCGDSRGAELQTHGAVAARALRQGRGLDAAHAFGVALGLRAHDAPPAVIAGGAVPVVTSVPVVTPPPVPRVYDVPAPGQMMEVGPEPPATPRNLDPAPRRVGRSARAHR